MATLPYVGRTPDNDGVVVPKSYADSTWSAQALTSAWITTQINAATPLLTNQTYVDNQDALLAKKTDVTAADTAYAATTLRSAANGIAGLDSSGNLLTAQLPSGIGTERVMKWYSMALSVSFEAIGTPALVWGASGTPTTATGSHTSTGGATTVVLCYVDTIPNGTITAAPTATPVYGGVAMTMLGSPILHNISGSAYGYGAVFYLFNPPAGAQTVATTLTAPGVASGGWFTTVQTVSYTNVGSLGTLVSNSDTSGSSTSATLTNIPCPTKGLISVGFGQSSGTGGSKFTALNQTIRYNNDANSQGLYFMLGEAGATGASTYSFTATLASGSGWAGFGVPMAPASVGSQIGQVAFTGSYTATNASAPHKLASMVIPDPGWPWRPLALAWVAGDSSGAANPGSRTIGTGNYGLLTVAPPANSPIYSIGICTGSFFTDTYPVTPYAAAGQTPTSVPAITGGLELDLFAQMWSGTTYTWYSAGLDFQIGVVPAL